MPKNPCRYLKTHMGMSFLSFFHALMYVVFWFSVPCTCKRQHKGKGVHVRWCEGGSSSNGVHIGTSMHAGLHKGHGGMQGQEHEGQWAKGQ